MFSRQTEQPYQMGTATAEKSLTLFSVCLKPISCRAFVMTSSFERRRDCSSDLCELRIEALKISFVDVTSERDSEREGEREEASDQLAMTLESARLAATLN